MKIKDKYKIFLFASKIKTVLCRKSKRLKAVKIDPNSKEGHYNLGRSEFFLGNFIEAKKIFETVVRKEKTYYSAHFMLGATQICCGNPEEGLASFLRFKQLIVWSSLPHAFKELAMSLSQAGFKRQAADLVRFAKRLDDNTPRSHSIHEDKVEYNHLKDYSTNLSMAS